jgi:ABC-type siderophore export system fused ATPase/permease subunit
LSDRKISFERYSLRYLLLILSCIIFIIELGYRSSSSGQLNMLKIFIMNWMEFQKKIFSKLSDKKIRYKDTELYNKYDVVLDAHKFLAERYYKDKDGKNTK